MSDLTQKVRDTFETVSHEVPVPAFDELAFRRKVADRRRRRGVRLAAGVAAAASVAAVAVYAVPGLLDENRAGGTPQVATAPPAVDPGALPEPLYFSAGMRLMAVTPDGEVHDLGPSEGVVGSTAEGVLAYGPESELVWIGASSSGEGDGSYAFERDAGPVRLPDTGPVQSAELSLDGRYVAWLDRDDVVTVHDLKSQELRQSVKVNSGSTITGVSERGVLVSEVGRLWLFEADGAVAVPTEQDGYGAVSDVAGELVTVADRDDVTRVYDVTASDGKADLIDSVPGTGRLAPYARGIVSVDGSEVWLWPVDGEPSVLGVGGTPQSAGWLDEDHVLVTSAEAGGTAVYLCPVADLACTSVAFSEDDVRLAE